ncbi:MAG: SIR2 family protein [Verrucomicrobiales bacterium]|nr:SIR2 family protein [Verrucomicrobiales bacterium]
MDNSEQLGIIKKDLHAIVSQANNWLMLIGSGTSMAMDVTLGMGALAEHLVASISDSSESWGTIRDKLKAGENLEKALTDVNLPSTLQNKIAEETFKFVSKKDIDLRDDLLTGEKCWTSGSLIKSFYQSLNATSPILPVITPNYDMLIEYACSVEGIPYLTGYHGGITKKLNWKKSREYCSTVSKVNQGRTPKILSQGCPRVELMKVHGSINLFRDSNNAFIENTLWASKYPEGYFPIIAPPGDSKTQDTLTFHDELFSEMKPAIMRSTAFMIVGYGFNDPHIHGAILQQVREKDCPLIVLTRDPSAKLDALIESSANTWVITGKEGDDSGTRINNRNLTAPCEVDGVDLWNSETFTKQILGN